MSNTNKILYNVKFSKDSNDRHVPSYEFEEYVGMAYRNESVYFFGDTGCEHVPFTDVYLDKVLKESKNTAQTNSDVRKLKDIIYDNGIRSGITVDFPSTELVIPKNARNFTRVDVSINYRLDGKPCSIEYEFIKIHEDDSITILSMLLDKNGYINVNFVGDDGDMIGFKSDTLLEILENSFRLLKSKNISKTGVKNGIRNLIKSNKVCGRVLFV